MKNLNDELKELVKRIYTPYQCGWTSQRSHGNFDDCFDDGYNSGQSWLAYEVGKIIGMELEEPEEPEYDI